MEEDSTDGSGRDWLRISVVICCLLAAVAVSFLMPTFATDGLAGSPLDRVLPGEGTETSASPAGGLGEGDGGGLGALNPGDATGVGGEVALDSETYGNTDTELHFTVESTRGTYWRTGSFDSYTGSGWERTGEIRELDGSIDHDGVAGEQIDYEVTLEQSATAVPTPWRPSVVEGVDDPLVTDGGAIRSETPLEPGSTIEGVSFAPEDDVDQLRSAGDSYPEEIEQRYTQLPDDTPDRIGTHTSELIEDADADGSYEKAAAVQEWLRSSKEYDLEVSERGENIADTFIFEMNAGYCEYFATAMVTMLRSQDIPSRYVVGYSTGQQVADGVYEVRAMNAHAWVEVYFEGLGWVKFDPTPGSDRLSTQEQALSDIDGDFDLTEPGSPGEQFEPGDERNEITEGLGTSLNQTAVPGEPVEVTVTFDEFPVPGVEVLFNGESVGITDVDGQVVGTVPDAEELVITIAEGDETTPEPFVDELFGNGSEAETENVTTETESVSTGGGGVPAVGTTTLGQRSMGQTGEQPAVENEGTQVDGQDADADVNPSDTHPIEREVTLVVSGESAPGQQVTVTARAGDLTLSDVDITLDGASVGETDGDGQIELELPDRTGDVELGAERGSMSGEKTITIPEISMELETGPLGSFSFGSATVEAELDDEPAAGIPVLIDGEEVGVTGTDGTTTVRFPFSTEATVSVTANGQIEQVTASGLLYVPAAVGAVIAALFGVMGYVLYRRSVDPRRVASVLRRLPRRIVAGGGRALLFAGNNADGFVAAGIERLRRTLLVTVGLFSGNVTPGEAWGAFRAWLHDAYLRISATIAALSLTDSSDGESRGTMTVQEAWRRFLDMVSMTPTATRTPGELATHAIEEDELPEQPVKELRDTFREVEYGKRSASDRLERTQEAVEQLERKSAETGETDR